MDRPISIPRPEFQRLYKSSRRLFHSSLLLLFKKNNLNRLRVGYVISKKVSKSAVKRNRIRRMLRESFRRHFDSFNSGYDIMFVAKPESNLFKRRKDVDEVIDPIISRLIKKTNVGKA